jgi:phosphate starvation-inducible PhoH-like protein
MEKGLIEVAPLAYMRGRTLDNAFIILDEAQNTTPAQMKMFLTRIGFGSKVLITGDMTQKDLPSGAVSGLDVALRVLKDIDDIGICNLTSQDVVRHPLVQKIVHAYDVYEEKTAKRKERAADYKRKEERKPETPQPQPSKTAGQTTATKPQSKKTGLSGKTGQAVKKKGERFFARK